MSHADRGPDVFFFAAGGQAKEKPHGKRDSAYYSWQRDRDGIKERLKGKGARAQSTRARNTPTQSRNACRVPPGPCSRLLRSQGY